ncbi:MAG: lipocalin family protein [Akkermansia sp.]|nr:lipocalin family protein [Akkermansia sp.]
MILRALQYYFSERKSPAPGGEPLPETTPASGLDWSRYMGRWYELARFETPFEYALDEVWTEYALLAGGRVSVTNYGTDAAGKVYKARATARPVAEGVLQISFVPLLRFISTPYHVLRVDAAYQNALVSNETGSCLWLLSRQSHAPLQQQLPLLQEAVLRGFDISQLRPTRQNYNLRLP